MQPAHVFEIDALGAARGGHENREHLLGSPGRNALSNGLGVLGVLGLQTLIVFVKNESHNALFLGVLLAGIKGKGQLGGVHLGALPVLAALLDELVLLKAVGLQNRSQHPQPFQLAVVGVDELVVVSLLENVGQNFGHLGRASGETGGPQKLVGALLELGEKGGLVGLLGLVHRLLVGNQCIKVVRDGVVARQAGEDSVV